MGVIGRPHGVRGLVHVHAYAEGDLAEYGPLEDDAGRRWTLADSSSNSCQSRTLGTSRSRRERWRRCSRINGASSARPASAQALPNVTQAHQALNVSWSEPPK